MSAPADTQSCFRPLEPADLPQAVEVLARAFHADPLWAYLIPDESKRARVMAQFYEPFAQVWIGSRQAYGVSNPVAGVAVWTAPDQKELDFPAFLRAGLLRLLLSPTALLFLRAGSIFARFDQMQKQYAPGPHYYLNTIAVLPDQQGKGLASALMRPILEKADQLRVGVYTETMTPANVGLYEYYGFKCVEQYRVPKTDLSIWAFYRYPAAALSDSQVGSTDH